MVCAASLQVSLFSYQCLHSFCIGKRDKKAEVDSMNKLCRMFWFLMLWFLQIGYSHMFKIGSKCFAFSQSANVTPAHLTVLPTLGKFIPV